MNKRFTFQGNKEDCMLGKGAFGMVYKAYDNKIK
jgi:hypothetical protein